MQRTNYIAEYLPIEFLLIAAQNIEFSYSVVVTDIINLPRLIAFSNLISNNFPQEATGLQEASVDKLIRNLANLNQTCGTASTDSINEGLKEYWKCVNELGSQLGLAKDAALDISIAK